MPRLHHLILLAIVLIAQICLAQKATIQDDAGQTVVVTPTTDEYGDVYSIAVSTVFTTSTGKAKLGSKASSSVTSSPTTSYRQTYTVAQGSIMDYSSYQSSVTGALNSMEAAAYKNYTATATTGQAGLYASSGSTPMIHALNKLGFVSLMVTGLVLVVHL
ncbi:uncharacterized protein IL334_002855 [Kwoniella shivajii]|uniref:Uncharacterized protein n=1 Tax=Kwoniella shivajii TaxID=564305 RepID=A0ABZ1CVW4_9TREE|nr:hypothetical protein IL334_002855 [Kwoniella shivajii]